MADSALVSWAVPRLQRFLPLEEDSLKQIITYCESLTASAAVEHLQTFLGDSPQALEFIASFTSRRTPPPSGRQSQSALQEVPKAKVRGPKKKQGISQLPARQVETPGIIAGAYMKRREEDYMPGKPTASKHSTSIKEAVTGQQDTQTPANPRAKPPPSAAGPLISDSSSSSKNASRNASQHTSRTASPITNAKAKIQITGGTPGHGQSTILNDLDSAIRTLEIQTNPSLSAQTPDDTAKRRCNCMATRHPLLEAAPNCLNCGKITCVKEGLGPCTFCGQALLSPADIQAMVRVLRDERGRERMQANNAAAHKRADAGKARRPMSGAAFLSAAQTSDSESESRKLEAAQAHRDKLLAFQANNVKRTRVFDEAADFDTPAAGTNMWASPAERALQLKRQQKILREQEWTSRPEYDKRRVVASIDLAGGKVVRKMAAVERPTSPASDVDAEGLDEQGEAGSFGKNPLLGGLIRPVAKVNGGEAGEKGKRKRKMPWRRVQDDNDDNERLILDGGVFGGNTLTTYCS